MNQQKQSTNLDHGRAWLDRAAQALNSDATSGVLPEIFAHVAALIGSGYAQLAAVEHLDSRHAETEARLAAWREVDIVAQEAISEAHQAMTARMRAEQQEIEVRTAKLAELDAAALGAAGQREQRAKAEARPHDDLNAHGVGSLSEAIALALGDAYAGIEFEDPTFERGTEAVMAVLRERAGADRA